MAYSQINTEFMAKALVAGQSVSTNRFGEYKFDENGQGVWEMNPATTSNQPKLTPSGEWIANLAIVGGVELSHSEIANVAFGVGLLVGQNRVALREPV
jgi:hypothetical protein